MRVKTEAEMLSLGRQIAAVLQPPLVIQLIGDVGAGKTTLTRGIAEGLGISEPVTSPSFTISKRYNFANGELVHYDFYRLGDPGIMSDELSETLSAPDAIVLIEWGDEISDLLPPDCPKIFIYPQSDDSREIVFQGALWKTCGKLFDSCGKLVEKHVDNSQSSVENSPKCKAREL